MLMRLGIQVLVFSLFVEDLVSLDGGEVSIFARLGLTGGPSSALSGSGLV